MVSGIELILVRAHVHDDRYAAPGIEVRFVSVEARGEARLTQMKLAKKLRQTQGFISRCENGQRGLNIIELRRYCRVLGITLPEFVDRFERAIGRKK